jgi:hypothetical protein
MLQGVPSRAAYRQANKEAIAAKKAAYYEDNREAFAAYNAAYREENREERAAYDATKRARKCGAEGTHTADDIKRLYAERRLRYLQGRTHARLSRVDHIVPMSRGGFGLARQYPIVMRALQSRQGQQRPRSNSLPASTAGIRH